MSNKPPTFEETISNVTQLQKDILEFRTAATKHGEDDKTKDKEMEASFKKAQTEMKNDDKDHKANMDDHEKVKDAFKQATNETDPEKKKMAMKRAMEMKNDHDSKKHARKGQEEKPKEDIDDQPQREAAITETVYKKVPLMNKILEATKLVNPQGVEKLEKFLMASTLAVVQDEYEKIVPYLAVIGVGTKHASTPNRGMIPFQAGVVLDQTSNPTDIFTASVDEIDFTQVTTKQILEMQS